MPIKINENAIYESVLNEFMSKNVDKGLMAKSYAEAMGEENKTKAVYIKHRAEGIISDYQKVSEYIDLCEKAIKDGNLDVLVKLRPPIDIMYPDALVSLTMMSMRRKDIIFSTIRSNLDKSYIDAAQMKIVVESIHDEIYPTEYDQLSKDIANSLDKQSVSAEESRFRLSFSISFAVIIILIFILLFILAGKFI